MCMFVYVCLSVYEAECVQCMLVYHVNMRVVLHGLLICMSKLLYFMCAFQFLYAHIAEGFDKT